MDGGRRKAERSAVSLLVKLKHQNVATFEEEFAINLSEGGMFIRSRQPQPVGTRLKFEVQLAGGQRVMRGLAVVRWIRPMGHPEGGPGMGVQFEQLDAPTRELVDRMLRARGGQAKTAAPLTASGSGSGSGAFPGTAAAGGPATAAGGELPPEVAALEAELRARYGDPSSRTGKSPSVPGISQVAPVIAPVAPAIASVAPVAPLVPPVGAAAPVAPIVPDVPVVTGVEEPGLEFDLPSDDEPLEGIPIEFETTPPPPDAIEIPIEALVATTPPPEDDIPLELELDDGSGGDEVEIPILDISSRPQGSGGEIELDLGDDEPLELATEPDRPRRPEPKPAAPARATSTRTASPGTPGRTSSTEPPATSTPARGSAPPRTATTASSAAGSPASAASKSTPARPAFAARAQSPSAPETRTGGPGAASTGGAASLPQVRRQAPAEAEAAPAPTLLKPSAPAEAPVKKSGPVFLTNPGKLSDTGPVIGIDLGTTNSCVALLQNGRPVILRSKEGYNTLPSLVSLSSAGKVLLAHRAKSQLIMNPSQTVYGAKRLVGRPFDSAVVREVRERFHYHVVPDDNGRAAVQLGQNVLSLDEVQGLVLKECRELAEQHLGQSVGRAVITVPAYYSEPQREAVRRAGAMAGLKVERVLNEPTAAALAFGLNKELDKKILVYDLGGGTFDATVLKIEKNVFEVLGTGGDVFLGGIDFDNLIVDLLLAQFQKKEGIPFDGDQVALSRVSEAAEKAKCALSERNTYDVHIPMLMMDAKGQPRELRCTLDRKQVEAAATPLVERTLDVVRDVLLDAQIKPKDVDEIILVGGMSRMPLVREKLKELFGKSAHAGVNADEAVALGAALYCGTVDKISSVTLIDVLPMTIGIGVPGGGFKRVIERNTPLPAQRSFAISTSKDNETTLELSVFQGEENNVAGNEYLGTIRIEGLPKMPKGTVKVAITLRLDSECVLHAEAHDLQTHKVVKATLATRYTSEEVQQKLGITAEKARAVEEARAKELQSRGGGFWGFLKRVVGRG